MVLVNLPLITVSSLMARSAKKSYPIPTSFKLGAKTWRVRYKRMPTNLGLCDPTKNVIYIHPDQSSIQQYSTFLHEITHAILFAMGYDEEEQFVTSFEELLLQVLTTQRHSKTHKKIL